MATDPSVTNAEKELSDAKGAIVTAESLLKEDK